MITCTLRDKKYSIDFVSGRALRELEPAAQMYAKVVRLSELAAKGQPADYETVLADIRRRDDQDTHRAAAPLRQAEDAVLADTSELDFEQSFQLLRAIIREKAEV